MKNKISFFEFVSFVLAKNLCFKILNLLLVLFAFDKKTFSFNKETFFMFCYGLIIVVLNYLLNLDLELLNFLYFGLLNFSLKKVTVANYCSFYLLLFFFAGMCTLWINL